MTSRTGSLTIFNGEAKEEGPALCLETRGEPEVERGERGGVLPAGNTEGNELPETFTLLFPREFKEVPDFASDSSDFTYVQTAQRNTFENENIESRMNQKQKR